MKKVQFALMIALSFGSLLTGCMTIKPSPLAPKEADVKAKQFSASSDQANIYIGRNYQDKSTSAYSVALDGKSIGALDQGMFFLVPLSPGKHKITVRASGRESNLHVDTQAGKNYYYSISEKGDLSIVLFEKMGQLMIRQEKRASAIDQ